MKSLRNEKLSKLKLNHTTTSNEDKEDDYVRILDYLTHEDDKKHSTTQLVYKKKNNNFSKLMNLKKSFVSPIDIIEEVKQKYDFHLRLKEQNLKEVNPVPVYLKSESNFFLSKEEAKPKVMSEMQSSQTIQVPLRLREYKDKAKKLIKLKDISSLSRNTNLSAQTNTFNKSSKFTFYEQMRLLEMNSILSRNKFQNENILIQNVTESFSSLFPEQFENMKQTFKFNSGIINSDNKIVQMFSVTLDIITQSLDQLTSEESNTLKYLSVLDSIFVDFCKHLSQNSNYRAEFLRKIWLKRVELMENLFTSLKSNVEKSQSKMGKFQTENVTLREQVDKLKKEKDEDKTEIRVLQRENEKWLQMYIEKDKKEKETKAKLDEYVKAYEEKNAAYEELHFKFNSRLNHNKRRQVYGEYIAEITGSTKNLMDMSNTLGGEFNDANSILENEFLKNLVQTISQGFDKDNDKDQATGKEQPKANNANGPISSLDVKDLAKSRMTRSTLTNRALKNKTSERGVINRFEQKKTLLENSVLNLNKETKQELINSLTNMNQFELYMNKGHNFRREAMKDLEVQTEITSVHVDCITDADIVKTLNSSADQVEFKIDQIESFLPENARTLFSEVKTEYNGMKKSVHQVLTDCDLMVKENDQMRNELESLKEQVENMKETYKDIYSRLVNCLRESNSDISDYTSSNTVTSELKDLLNQITTRHIVAVESEALSSMYLYIDKPLLKKPTFKEDPDNSRFSSNMNLVTLNSANVLNYKALFAEFNEMKGKIKINISFKKVMRIINTIYFDKVEKVYFKKDKLNFDSEEHFIEFGEVLMNYFIENFGINSLARKKALEFLQGCQNFDHMSKRISLFTKFIQINKHKKTGRFEFEQLIQPIQPTISGRRGSVTASHNPHGNSTKHFFDIFVTRQIILLIQFLKTNNLVVKDDSINSIFILHHRLYENCLQVYSRLPLNVDMKQRLWAHIEKAKRTFTRNLKSYIIVDFDDLIECVANILCDLKSIFTGILKWVYKALDTENKQSMNLLDFVIANQYIFVNKLSYDQIENLFYRFCDGDIWDGHLPFEQFEVIAIEGDFLDVKKFNEFVKINIDINAVGIIRVLQEEARSSAMCVLDDILKRFMLSEKISPVCEMMIEFVSHLKARLLSEDMTVIGEAKPLWIALRVADEILL